MSRRKRRVYGRSGLFEFVPGGIADVPDDNPLTRPCLKPRGCGVPAGQPCRRQVPRRGWIDLRGYHDARRNRPTRENP
jgi:hypothetical protein